MIPRGKEDILRSAFHYFGLFFDYFHVLPVLHWYTGACIFFNLLSFGNVSME